MRFPPVILLALPLILSGCVAIESQSADSDSLPALPSITVEENFRDELARTEFAIEASTRIMGDLATQCPDCRQVLDSARQSASERLDILGGMWNPWESPQSGEMLPTPPEVADAPTTPMALVGYMLATADAQLDFITENGPPGSALFAQTLAGRSASAATIANYYGIDTAEAKDSIPPEALQLSAGTPLSVSGTITPNADSDPQGIASAILSFDCLGTESGRTSLSDVDEYQRFYNVMIARQETLLTRLDKDPRPLRCSAQIQSQDDLFNELVGTDIAMIGSTDSALRNLGRKWLDEDLEKWSHLGTAPATAPGSSQ